MEPAVAFVADTLEEYLGRTPSEPASTKPGAR